MSSSPIIQTGLKELVPAVGRNGLGNILHFHDDQSLTCPTCSTSTQNDSSSVIKKIVGKNASRSSRTLIVEAEGSTSTISCTRVVYVSPLAKDAKQRTESKLRRRASREEKGLSAQPKKALRTGRGGAGLVKQQEKIDSKMYPETAALTRVYEARVVAQEQALLEASRARAFEAGRMGRGGSGNMTAGARERRLKMRHMKKALKLNTQSKGDRGSSIANGLLASRASCSSVGQTVTGSESAQSSRLRQHFWKRKTPSVATRSDIQVEEDCPVILIGRSENNFRGLLHTSDDASDERHLPRDQGPAAFRTADDYYDRCGEHRPTSLQCEFRSSLESVLESLEIE